MALGGGIPVGRSTIFWGNSKTGKSTIAGFIALQVLNSVRGDGSPKRVAWFDTEVALDKQRMDGVGLTPYLENDHLHIFGRSVQAGEDMIDAMTEMLDKAAVKSPDMYDLIVWDSIAATPFLDEIEASAGDNQMAIAARKWSRASKILLQSLSVANIPIIFTNHVRQVIGQGTYPGFSWNGEYMPSGTAMPFYASLILRFNSPAPIKKRENNNDVLYGMTFRSVTAKSRIAGAPEYKKAQVTVDIDPQTGASEIAIVPELISAAQELGIFTLKDGVPSHNGNSKYFQDEEVGSNEAEIKKRLILDDNLYTAVYKACRDALDAKQDHIRNNQGVVENESQNGSGE
jgi:RecA/RadA recombinase